MIFVVERGKLTIVLYQYLILVQYSVSYWILVILTETCSPLPTSCCRGRRGQCVIKRHDVSLENFHTKFKTLGTITRTSHYVMNISLFEGFAQIQYRHISEFCFVAPGDGRGDYLSFFFPTWVFSCVVPFGVISCWPRFGCGCLGEVRILAASTSRLSECLAGTFDRRI